MKTITDINSSHIDQLLSKFGIIVNYLKIGEDIPGSYWGPPEAGIIQDQLYVRPDTPIHSALHESCHFICMDNERRKNLHTNTGGDYDEENAVCYLQVILADHISGIDQSIIFTDMDNWGYTFRLGSAKKWFYEDADDAFDWLQRANILTVQKQLTWKKHH